METRHHNYAFSGSLLSTYCVPGIEDLTVGWLSRV